MTQRWVPRSSCRHELHKCARSVAEGASYSSCTRNHVTRLLARMHHCGKFVCITLGVHTGRQAFEDSLHTTRAARLPGGPNARRQKSNSCLPASLHNLSTQAPGPVSIHPNVVHESSHGCCGAQQQSHQPYPVRKRSIHQIHPSLEGYPPIH